MGTYSGLNSGDTELDIMGNGKSNGERRHRNGKLAHAWSDISISVPSMDKDNVKDDDTVVQPKSWCGLCIDYTQDTSLHGVRYTTIDTRFTYCRRILWLLAITGALCCFLMVCVIRIGDYLRFEINTSITEKMAKSVEFPKVTICNQNAIRLTEAAAGGYYYVARNITTGQATKNSNRQCLTDEFQCSSGECIPKLHQCDSFPDCPDRDDESQCDPCPILKVDSDNKDLKFLGKYDLQIKTFVSDNVVYLHQQSQIYISYVEGKKEWQFSYLPFDGEVVAHTASDKKSPQNINSEWSLPDKTSFGLQFSCTTEPAIGNNELVIPSRDYDLDKLDTSLDTSIDIKKMFMEGVTPLKELITTCKWKGKDCDLETMFYEQATDMGLCYTFYNKEDMDVTKAGPGHALALTINIEAYQYTKDTADGSGIQVYFHDHFDVPLMKTGSTSISPGLYSMIALEATDLESLAAPHGSCEANAPEGFDQYTTNTCIITCESNLAVEECGCVDIYMTRPVDIPYCSIAGYNCLKNKVYGSASSCQCKIPCKSTLYVTSLSFASVSKKIDTNKMTKEYLEIEKKLKEAHEVYQRIDIEKLRQNIRHLYILDFECRHFQQSLNGILKELDHHHTSLMLTSNMVYEGCQYLNTLQLKFLWKIENMIGLVDSYIYFYHSAVFDGILKFVQQVQIYDDEFDTQENDYLSKRKGKLNFQQQDSEMIVSDVNLRMKNVSIKTDLMEKLDLQLRVALEEANASFLLKNISLEAVYNSGEYFDAFIDVKKDNARLTASSASVTLPDDDFWEHTSQVWVRFSSLRSSFINLKSVLENTQNEQLKEIVSSFEQYKGLDLTELKLTLNDDYLRLIQDELHFKCEWCSTSPNQPLIETIVNKFVQYLESKHKTDLKQLSDMTDEIYSEFLIAIKTEDKNRINDIRNNKLKAFNELTDTTHKSLIDSLRHPLDQVKHFISDFSNIFDYGCSKSIALSTQELIQANDAATVPIENLMNNMTEIMTKFSAVVNSYIKGDISLTQLIHQLYMTDIIFKAKSTVSIVNDHVNEKLSQIDRFISLTHHSMLLSLVAWDASFLADTSSYWKYYNINSNELKVTQNLKETSIIKQFESLGIESNEKEKGWREYSVKSVQTIMANLEYQYSALNENFTSTVDYFEEFLDGNRINGDYFKDNELQMDVYFAQLNTKSIKQLESFPLPSLLSEVGGIMGLLLGASALTLFEIVDLIWYNSAIKLRNAFKRWRSKSNNNG